jgi:Asp-tRNA(Asn)/Glu-tRNA(Gln) amidotransferase A subunit family amidase
MPAPNRWAHKPSTNNSPVRSSLRAARQEASSNRVKLVTAIVKAGGIPITKTNLPQAMYSFECSSPLWGRTVNPYSRNHTSGGSSGGEGALLACDGSALGIGSDIGGSLRVPAHFCGIYSLKPSAGRMSVLGAKSQSPSSYNVPEN